MFSKDVRFLLPSRPCSKCGGKVAFIEDLPRTWLGYCKRCDVILIINGCLDNKVGHPQLQNKNNA